MIYLPLLRFTKGTLENTRDKTENIFYVKNKRFVLKTNNKKKWNKKLKDLTGDLHLKGIKQENTRFSFRHHIIKKWVIFIIITKHIHIFLLHKLYICCLVCSTLYVHMVPMLNCSNCSI